MHQSGTKKKQAKRIKVVGAARNCQQLSSRKKLTGKVYDGAAVKYSGLQKKIYV